MARMKTLLAICLALVLAFSSAPVTWAGGPGGTSTNTTPADGGDGHPWDDGTTESNTDPGTNPLDPSQIVTPLMTRQIYPDGADWVRGVIVKIWEEVLQTKIGRTMTGSRIVRIR